MTTLLDSPPTVIDSLRGERDRRPRANTTAAAGLRARLEEGIAALLGGAPRESPVTVRASSLRAPVPRHEPHGAPLAQMRGVLVTYALRLISVGHCLDEIFDDSFSAWRCADPQSELMRAMDALSADERARLAADVSAHGVTLRRSLGALSGHWSPRTSLRAHQRLGGGNVVLRDVVDLMAGSTLSEASSVVLLDVTTATLDDADERIMRYHALVQTLRTSTVPLRTSIFSTATGELWHLDVDDELLARGVDDVLVAIERLATEQ